jgi:putative NAD(P)-binding protein
MPAERIVVGGSVAALVAAEALAARGARVRLLLPEHGVGGGFAPLHRDGRALELGVRLLELSYEDDGAPMPPLRDYRPGVGGHRPYARLVAEWVRARVGDRLREIDRPTMVVGGRRVDDILFTVDLARLAGALEDGERARMADEVARALDAAGHPAGVLAPGAATRLAGLSLHDASLTNHGAAFHERFIAPLCDKVLPAGAHGVLAPLRRVAWAPLFHPATLLEALRGERPRFRPRRTFHTVAADAGGGLVDEQLRRVESDARVRVERAGALTRLDADAGSVRMRFSGGDAVRARRPVLGVSAGELFSAAGVDYAPERVRTAIAWLELSKPAGLGHLVHVLDPDNPVLRVSVSGEGTLLCVELRHDVPAERLAETARVGLAAAGLLAADVPTHTVATAARPTFAAPSPATRDALAGARASLRRRRLDVELVGGALGLGADALNEQIVQGIRVGAMSP